VIHAAKKTMPINVVSKLASDGIIAHTCAGEWRNVAHSSM